MRWQSNIHGMLEHRILPVFEVGSGGRIFGDDLELELVVQRTLSLRHV